MRLSARAAVGRCAYCHAGPAPDDVWRSCLRCRTRLHRSCWREALACPTLGCAGRGPLDCPGPAATRFRALAAQANGWLEPDAVSGWLHGAALSPWSLLGLLAVACEAFELLVLSTLVVGAGLVLQVARPRPAAGWLLVLSGAALGVGVRLLVVAVG